MAHLLIELDSDQAAFVVNHFMKAKQIYVEQIDNIRLHLSLIEYELGIEEHPDIVRLTRALERYNTVIIAILKAYPNLNTANNA